MKPYVITVTVTVVAMPLNVVTIIMIAIAMPNVIVIVMIQKLYINDRVSKLQPVLHYHVVEVHASVSYHR